MSPDPADTQPEPPPSRPHAWRGVARGFGSVAAVIAVVALVVAARGGLVSRATSGSLRPLTAPPATLPGLQSTPAPWAPEYPHLAQRMAALQLPDLSDSVFHIHAMLRVYVDGHAVTVPANVGLPDTGDAVSPLHTHDTSGIIHMESTRPYAFTLGEFFDIWGVAFTPTQLGGYRVDARNALRVFVNGLPVADGPAYVMRAHDTIIVGYGPPGSFPTNQPGDFSGGL